MNPEFDKGYLMALKKMRSEIQVYADLIIDVEDMSEEELEVATKICYDITEMLAGEIDTLEEF